MLRAMKKYGMIVAENGPSWSLSGAPHANWNDGDLSTLSQIKGQDFEVVSHGTITPFP